jgi:hypothetical protein
MPWEEQQFLSPSDRFPRVHTEIDCQINGFIELSDKSFYYLHCIFERIVESSIFSLLMLISAHFYLVILLICYFYYPYFLMPRIISSALSAAKSVGQEAFSGRFL